MNNSQIKDLIASILSSVEGEFTFHYKAPVVIESCHAIEIESKKCLGTISVWASGMMDWHIFDIETSTENMLGHSEINDQNDLHNVMLSIFEGIRERDKSKTTGPGSVPDR
jgi:hypothetical protein